MWRYKEGQNQEPIHKRYSEGRWSFKEITGEKIAMIWACLATIRRNVCKRRMNMEVDGASRRGRQSSDGKIVLLVTCERIILEDDPQEWRRCRRPIKNSDPILEVYRSSASGSASADIRMNFDIRIRNISCGCHADIANNKRIFFL